MPDIVGVRFRKCGKIYDFDINEQEILQGDLVVAESCFGISLGHVVKGKHFQESSERDFKKVVRKATNNDIETREKNLDMEKEANSFCLERIKARGLPMKLVETEATLDKKRIIFYFTADGRIDFRELVKDLANKFKTRIEMRQIGVRDESKFIGGIGICGREVCCKTFLSDFAPISIKMAKKQALVLNQEKLSGLCGRLMCCLGFEINANLGDCLPVDHTEAARESENEDYLVIEDRGDEFATDKATHTGTGKSPITRSGRIVSPEPGSNEKTNKKPDSNRPYARRRRRTYKSQPVRPNDSVNSGVAKPESYNNNSSNSEQPSFEKDEKRGKGRYYKKRDYSRSSDS